MNRGRARQIVFHDERYYQAFLSALGEVKQRFQCVIHAYCLMGNHYHLLIETPNANLSRIMRHINGVYTQRYNRLKMTDGPLFRGRYKAMLIDSDAYLLRLSRYIHRNPIDMKSPMVSCLEEYPWSSYPAYIGKAKSPVWLERETVYSMLGSKQRYRGYADYIMDGVDEETAEFYQKGNIAAIIGSRDFKGWVYEELLPGLQAEEKVRIIQPDLSMDVITSNVATAYGNSVDGITRVVKGLQKENEARKVAMYLCQELSAAKLREIADYFNLSHVGSVSYITHKVRKMRNEDKRFGGRVEGLIKSIMKQAT
ncbi:MAG: transposase [Candidatus Thiodiazotropha sp. (ex Dulcina madagascariensis)]|nr:transposase [Candidatus Thiodiazotropha sp. (ex Dulcina madagascariensis)]